MAIEWNEKFATEDSHVDEQHRQIFRFANRLEVIAGKEQADTQEVESLLRFLDTYIQNHFRYEEACMLKRRCPVAQKNRSEHIALKTFIDGSFETYQQNGYQQQWAQELHKKLEHWLTHHICHIDIQLRDYPEK